MINTLFFDLDDTLLWDKQSIKQAFIATCYLAEQKYDIDANRLEDAVRKEARELYSSYQTYSFTQQIGINPFEGLWGDFLDDTPDFKVLRQIAPTYRKDAWNNGLKAIGINDPDFAHYLAEQFPIERKRHPFVYSDTFDTLEVLKKRDFKLLLLTNGSPDLQRMKLEITPELAPYFNHIVISGEFGRGKPDPSLFNYALDKIKASKDEVLMIGDNLNTDILGSSRVGIKNIWINHDCISTNDIIPTYEVKQLNEIMPIIDKLSK